MRRIIDIEDRPPLLQTLPLSIQHIMAMFGATVLVPMLLGVSPANVLLMNGVGTLLYSVVVRGGIPAYLGSSFAFIAPTMLVMSRGSFAQAQSGFIFFGLFFVVVSFIVRRAGTGWLEIAMPAPVMGAVVAVIGLELAPEAARMAGLAPPASATAEAAKAFVPDPHVAAVSLLTLVSSIGASLLFRGFLQAVPVLVGIAVGMALAGCVGLVDLSPVAAAHWFALPTLSAPEFNLPAILTIAPACLVVLAEHVGHLVVTGHIVGRDLIKNPGLDRSLFGDGLSNILSGLCGSPPNTTYGENIGVMAITGVYSVHVIRGAAIIAVAASFVGKFCAVIQSIPVAVMGGICIYLFGVVAVAGIRMLVERRVDFSRPVAMALSAIVLVLGVSGAKLRLGSVELKGMALATLAGIVLALLVYAGRRLGLVEPDEVPE